MNILRNRTSLIAALLASTLPLVAADSSSSSSSPSDRSSSDRSSSASSYNSAGSSNTNSSTWQRRHQQMEKDYSVNKILDAKAQSKDGQKLGKVEDLLVNPQSGKVDFVVLGQGGVLGVGEDRIPVPWKAVTTQSDGTLIVNKDKTQLRSAPSIKKDYSNLDQPDYTVTVYEFYELPPNAGASESPGGASSGSSTNLDNSTNSSSSNP